MVALIPAKNRSCWGGNLDREDIRAIQFSLFPLPSWAFDPFPPSGGRLGWGEKHGLGTPPTFTPTLTLPVSGGGKRLTGTDHEN